MLLASRQKSPFYLSSGSWKRMETGEETSAALPQEPKSSRSSGKSPSHFFAKVIRESHATRKCVSRERMVSQGALLPVLNQDIHLHLQSPGEAVCGAGGSSWPSLLIIRLSELHVSFLRDPVFPPLSSLFFCTSDAHLLPSPSILRVCGPVCSIHF